MQSEQLVSEKAASSRGRLTPYAADPKPVGAILEVLLRGAEIAIVEEAVPYASGG